MIDVDPSDQILEIGSGPGAAADLICQRLDRGRLLCIDRSEAGHSRTQRRNAKHIEDGKLTVRQIDLASLKLPRRMFDKIFAVNVNLFWVRDASAEVELLRDRLLPGGAIYLFFEAPDQDERPAIVKAVGEILRKFDLEVSVAESQSPRVLALIGRRD